MTNFLKNYKLGIFLFFLAIIGMNGCSSYNQIAEANEDVNGKWAQVENVYQRRSDLIPNLVEVVKGYAEHEKSTFTDVITARSKATSITIDASKLDSETLKKFDEAQSGITQALSKLMMVSERYPDLKANENYKQLMTELTGTENRISIERRSFNETVKYFNKMIIVFPKKLWANLFGFEKRVYFEADKSASVAPKIKMTK